MVPHRPIGIDLGTTFSVIAFLDESGRPVSIANDAGDFLTPTAVSVDDGAILIGKEAVKQAVFEPEVFADCFKRDMGRREFHRPIAKQLVPPEVLSGLVLKRLKQDAERRLGSIEQVVITVPAFFDETRRRATQEAGRIAGLDVLDIINEPTAAAVAFGFQSALKNERVLVYDLGGGTFDVTVLEITGPETGRRTFRTLATDGDVQLGGRDFDERLVDHVAEAFLTVHRSDPRSDPHDAAQLWQEVQVAKHTLSGRTKVSVPCFHAGTRMRVDVDRTEFERLTADLLERTETTTRLVLRQAKLDWSGIDRVLLVGGSTRMPMVGEMLRRLSGKEPDRSMSPDEAVAHGAALYAGLLMSDPSFERSAATAFDLINVNSHSLGILGIDQRENRRRNVVIIAKNTPLPCKVVRKFATARENQSSVRVTVVEGESERPEHCIHLGECVVRNLPPGLPKGTKVEVEYSYSADGRISVRARVPQARQSASVELQYESALNLNLDDWVAKLNGNGQASGSSASEDELDKYVSYLDELLVSLGQQAAKLQLPETFQAKREAAIDAAEELTSLTAEYVRAERNRQNAIGQAEVLKSTATLSQLTVAAQLAEVKSRAAYRSLAQDCLDAEFAPQPLRELYEEIKRLQS
jgi:molecular chaperone DnaK